MNQQLTEDLYELVEIIQSEIENKEDLEKNDIEYTNFEVDQYDYELIKEEVEEEFIVDNVFEGGENKYFSKDAFKFDREQTTKEEISNEYIGSIVLSVKETDIFEDVSETLKHNIDQNYDVGEIKQPENLKRIGESPELILTLYIRRVAEGILENNLTDEYITRCVASIVEEIKQSKFERHAKIWVNGLIINEELEDEDEEIFIKRPEKEDFEAEIKSEVLQVNSASKSPRQIPTAKIETDLLSDSYEEIRDRVEIIKDSLSLFELANIDIIGSELKTESPLERDHKAWENEYHNTSYVGYIESSESVSQYFDFIFPKFIDLIAENSEDDFLSIAFNRYKDGLDSENASYSHRIASAMMAAEALYLKDTEKSELSERLAQRTAFIIHTISGEPIVKVYNKMKKGYSYRSQFVHGSKIETENKTELMKMSRDLLDYVRISIIFHLQVREKYTKEKLISKINNSILVTNSRTEFENEIDELCDYGI